MQQEKSFAKFISSFFEEIIISKMIYIAECEIFIKVVFINQLKFILKASNTQVLRSIPCNFSCCRLSHTELR